MTSGRCNLNVSSASLQINAVCEHVRSISKRDGNKSTFRQYTEIEILGVRNVQKIITNRSIPWLPYSYFTKFRVMTSHELDDLAYLPLGKDGFIFRAGLSHNNKAFYTVELLTSI